MRDNAPAPTAETTRPAEFLSINDAAALLGVSRAFINRRIADGSLTAYKLNGYTVRLDAAQVRALAVPVRPVGGAR